MYGFGASHIGRVRLKNEDAIFVSNTLIGNLNNLYIVADGMGGHKAGNIASTKAIEAYVDNVKNSIDEEALDTMVSAIAMANKVVYNLSNSNEEYSNMGTTLVACTINDSNAYIAHIGDSRVYKISGTNIEQVTNDHSYVAEMVRAGKMTKEEAITHPQRSCITRAIGTDMVAIADGLIVKVEPEDKILLCSDGLSNMIDEKVLLEIGNNEGMNTEDKVELLIELANAKGGLDNISVILIDLGATI